MKTFFKTIPRPLNLLVSSALLLLLLKVFLFNNIGGTFNGAHELGIIVESILASIIASYFFYLIVVHFKEVKDRKAIYPHIRKWTNYIISDCKHQLQDLSEESGVDLHFSSLSETKIKQALRCINSLDNAPLLIDKHNTHANWIQYFANFSISSKEHISKINSQLKFLDANLVAILSKIEDCVYFNSINMMISQQTYNVNLESISGPFLTYCQYCRELEMHMEDELT